MTILTALAEFYDRLAERDDGAPYGYMPTPLVIAVTFNEHGHFGRFIDLRVPQGNKLLAQKRLLPRLRNHNNSGTDPFMFWDNSGYALGVVAKEMKRGSPDDLFKLFRTRQETEIAPTEDQTLRAFLSFLSNWKPEDCMKLGFPEDALDGNVAFMLEGAGSFIHEHPSARRIWAHIAEPDADPGQCLVTGKVAPIRRL